MYRCTKRGLQVCLCVVLWLLGILPGIIFAFFIYLRLPKEKEVSGIASEEDTGNELVLEQGEKKKPRPTELYQDEVRQLQAEEKAGGEEGEVADGPYYDYQEGEEYYQEEYYQGEYQAEEQQ